MLQKTCTKCGLEKPHEDYELAPRLKTGRRANCRVCKLLQDKERRLRRTPEQIARTKAMSFLRRPKDTETHARYRRNNQEAIRKSVKKHREKYRMKFLLYHARDRSSKKGIPYDLDEHRAELEARLDKGLCELTGFPFASGNGRQFNSPSLDRIHPNLGYVYTNIRLICLSANMALGNWGEENTKQLMSRWLVKET